MLATKWLGLRDWARRLDALEELERLEDLEKLEIRKACANCSLRASGSSRRRCGP